MSKSTRKAPNLQLLNFKPGDQVVMRTMVQYVVIKPNGEQQMVLAEHQHEEDLADSVQAF